MWLWTRTLLHFFFLITALQLPVHKDQRLIEHHRRPSVTKAVSARHGGTKYLFLLRPVELLSIVTLWVKQQKMHQYWIKFQMWADWCYHKFEFPCVLLANWNNIKDISVCAPMRQWKEYTIDFMTSFVFHNCCFVWSWNLIWFIFVMHIFNESQLSLSKKKKTLFFLSVWQAPMYLCLNPERFSAYRKLYTTFPSIPPTVPPVVKITGNFTAYYFTDILQYQSSLPYQLPAFMQILFYKCPELKYFFYNLIVTIKTKWHNDPDCNLTNSGLPVSPLWL